MLHPCRDTVGLRTPQHALIYFKKIPMFVAHFVVFQILKGRRVSVYPLDSVVKSLWATTSHNVCLSMISQEQPYGCAVVLQSHVTCPSLSNFKPNTKAEPLGSGINLSFDWGWERGEFKSLGFFCSPLLLLSKWSFQMCLGNELCHGKAHLSLMNIPWLRRRQTGRRILLSSPIICLTTREWKTMIFGPCNLKP